MKSLRLLDRRSGYSLASIGLLLGLVAPSLVPTFASAGTITSRKITMSNASASSTAVSYHLEAVAETAIASGGGLVIEFCSDSPLIGASCVHPTGMTVASVSAGAGTATDIDATDHAIVKWVAGTGISAAGAIDVTLSGITNPSAVGTFYARVTTYANGTDIGTYTDAATPGTYADSGAVALSTSNSVGITAYVLESMTFCVSGVAPSGNCGTLGTPTPVTSPSMTLGEVTGTVKALSPTAISTGSAYAQLSTNAASGAIVNLKSNATTCGGLFRNGNVANCNITPETGNASFAAGSAKFGLTVGSPSDADGALTPSGTLQRSSTYDASKYFIDYVAGDATGVTSSYGSALFDTNSLPVNNKNIPITFGASISNGTPAGVYGANLSLVATGTF